MREIKFRANVKGENKVYIVQSIHIEDEYCVLTVGELLDGKSINKKLSDVNLMQYTGLKDKNGKEIYEGNILSFKETNYVVEFQVGEFTFKNLYNGIYMSYMYLGKDNLEIIGNIYENPDLINNK